MILWFSWPYHGVYPVFLMILTHSRLPVASNSLFLETPCRDSPRQYFGMDRPTTCQQFNCSLSFVKIAHTLCSLFFFFQQDHRYHKYHSSYHVILSFVPSSSSNGLHDSEHRTDECHGQSSIQEYDAIWWLERARERDFYHPFSRRLKNKNKIKTIQKLAL